jgi:hypothetical protein
MAAKASFADTAKQIRTKTANISQKNTSWKYVKGKRPTEELFFFSGVGLTSPGTAATSGLLYSPRW